MHIVADSSTLYSPSQGKEKIHIIDTKTLAGPGCITIQMVEK